jgi:hypothetical protein
MTQTSGTPYRNSNLFSNYYLEKYLPESLEWKKKDHIAVFEQIKNIYNRESASIKTLNEKQLENHFFNDVFSILGFVYEVTEPTHARNFPDYAFFFDRTGLDDAHKNKETIPFFTNAVAIGEVKQWKVDLDQVSKNEYNISENPSLQIWTYLEDTEQKWGILSNGRIWRLYCKGRHRDNYLEIDLSRLIESNDIDAFRFFYYFFRKDAFVKSKEGQAFLDRVLNESQDYAQKIGDDLKDNVYWAMKRIAEGFVNQKSNHLDSRDPATLARVQNNTMILLYRFLFLLYAEGKGLLDLHDQRYREYYSFHHIKHYIAETQDGPAHQRFDTVKSSIQSDLKDLFKLVDQGSESFGIPKTEYYIPAYNGGLFDPQKHPDLEHWEIGDKYLADAIDLLSRSKLKEGHRDFVDYSTLEIRNLGSIYEGLLEYKLKVAESDLVVSDSEWVTLDGYNASRKQKKTIADFDENNRVSTGHLYLATDKGERKSSGSYYTPDYIVNYIVKNTIGPVVEQKWKDAQEKSESCIDATLSINVLDPAMGSGHFLVGAVDFLSQKLLEAVQKDFESGKITDTAPYTNDWARRDVVSHCIYGVDLNELAVELAKVGLWLTTISRDKPLSFLDHRLKQGNSLIGARLTNLRYYPGKEPKERNQTELPTSISPRFIGHILSKIAELDAIEDNHLEDIKRKEKAFEEFRQLPEYQKAKGLANVYTATYFGNVITPTEKKSSEALYQDLVWAIAGDVKEWQSKTWYPWFKQAATIAQEKSFFHWELEFPEIFFDTGKLQDNPGWDAVIGNPPYANAWAMTDLDEISRNAIAVLSPRKEFLSGHWDLYIPFVSIAILFMKSGGYHSFILPDAVGREKYAVHLRLSIVHDLSLIRWTQYDEENVFADASRHCSIYVILKKSPAEDHKVIYEKPPRLNEPAQPLYEVPLSKWLVGTTSQFRPKAVEGGSAKIIEKIDTNSVHLGQFCYVMVGATVHSKDKVSFKKADVITKTPIGNAKRFFDGKTLHRYEIDLDGRFLDYKPDLMYGPRIPELFENPKILVRDVTEKNEKLVVAYDPDGLYCDHLVTCVTPYKNVEGTGAQTEFEGYPHLKNNIPSLFYTLGVVASSLIAWYFKEVFATGTLQGSYSHTYPKQVRAFPIHRISFTTPADHRTSLVNETKELYRSFTQSTNPQPLLAFIDARLATQPEESDVVHDLLAFLAEQMVEMNKAKNAEIKTFLNFVESEIGASVDVLSNKTLIQEYYANDFIKIVDVLVKNKSKINEGYNPKSPTNRKNLEAWYTDSCGKLKPLMGKIDATDTLINQIVYKLYGLTAEEIVVVEGSGK